MNKTLLSLLLATVLGLAGQAAWAQDDNPPEILTSDLAPRTVLESKRLEVNFVIVDTDNVTDVRINGEPVSITPGDTVLITRTFNFEEDVTRLQVTATDEEGHSRTMNYLVFAPGVDPATAEKPKEPAQRFFATYDVRVEYDDNPSNDLSSPISIEGVDLVGVVPDSQQSDTRTNILASAGYITGRWTFYGGGNHIAYSDELYKSFEMLAVFLGGVYTYPRSQDDALQIGYMFSDINLGGSDYAQTHLLSPGWRFLGSDSDGDSTTTTYGLDIVAKDFASADQDSATVFALKREYLARDKAMQDSYRSLYQIGSGSEGIVESEFNYIAADWDWRNRWDSGLLWNIGTGVQYRDYANDTPLSKETFLGDTRVDVPARFSTAVGYQFSPLLRVLASYRYSFNLSNKSPYVRQIIGIGVNGAF